MTLLSTWRAALISSALCLGLSAPASAKDWQYTVKPGDTLWDLCLTYTTYKKCWLEIGSYNGVDYPPSLSPGTRVNFPVAWLKAQPAPAKVLFVTGEAQLTLPDTAARPAAAGDTLPMGATLATRAKSFATVQFADGAILVLEPSSEAHMDLLTMHEHTGMVNSKVNLLRGAAKSVVPKRQPASDFSVTTPSAIAAVRGTEFRVSATEGAMASEVFEGTIDVAKEAKGKAQKVAIPESFGIQVEQNKPLGKPVALLPAITFTDQPEAISLSHTVVWQPLPDAKHYKVELLADQEADEVRTQTTQPETTWTLTVAEAGCVKVRVSGIDTFGLQGMPAVKRFCAAEPIAAPAELTQKGLALSWEAAPSATAYRVEISPTEDFTESTSEVVTTNAFTLNKAHKKHFVRVTPLDAQGRTGDTSTSHQVRLQNTEGIFATLGAMLLLILL